MHAIKLQPRQNIIKLNGIPYKGHLIGHIPNSFCNPELGDGIFAWFNYKGLTYLPA